MDRLRLIGVERWQLRRPRMVSSSPAQPDSGGALLSLCAPGTEADRALWTAIVARLGLRPADVADRHEGEPGTVVCESAAMQVRLSELRHDPARKKAFWRAVRPLVR